MEYRRSYYNGDNRLSQTHYVQGGSQQSHGQLGSTRVVEKVVSGGASERVINETKMPSRVVETRQLQEKVVGSNELQSYEVSRHVVGADNVRTYQTELPVKEQRPRYSFD